MYMMFGEETVVEFFRALGTVFSAVAHLFDQLGLLVVHGHISSGVVKLKAKGGAHFLNRLAMEALHLGNGFVGGSLVSLHSILRERTELLPGLKELSYSTNRALYHISPVHRGPPERRPPLGNPCLKGRPLVGLLGRGAWRSVLLTPPIMF
jgi:hypothetical protein